MLANVIKYLFIYFFTSASFICVAQVQRYDVIVIGGGASGTMAGIQSARLGATTLIVESTEWLGGMLTSAGVSAIDGNHNLPSGLWNEFRNELYKYYGGPNAVQTGWVSNTLFEPSVGNKLLKKLAAEKNLTVLYKTRWLDVKRINNEWHVTIQTGKKKYSVAGRILIDATELGDVSAKAGAAYDVGMDSRNETNEFIAPEKSNRFIQDVTYVATLKDYGKGTDKTIKKPVGYNEDEFKGCCDVADVTVTNIAEDNCHKMLQYGRLPNNKYMINWPRYGNDIYMDVIDSSDEARTREYEKAKQHTLRFVYYIQTKLGYKNLGIADDEYPTKDKLPFFPYFRESRRVKGLVQFTLNDIMNPFDQSAALYRTGIAVGDYPLDHHSNANKEAPKLDFFRVRVPSYNVPLGSLIPKNIDGLIVAEKSIGVTNIVNGATRLQPVVMLIGQAAGTLAALSAKNNQQPKDISVREVQKALLQSKAYLMPYIDVKPGDIHFDAIQRIGATGIIKGFGVPCGWANQTWFYPHREISEYEFLQGIRSFYQKPDIINAKGDKLTVAFLIRVMKLLDSNIKDEMIEKDWNKLFPAIKYNTNNTLDREQAAVLIDTYLKPFDMAIDINGHLKN